MDSSSTRRLGNILDTLWYAGSATETLMILLALLAATVSFAGVFPQQPPGLPGAGAERWLASTASNYPGTGQLLRQVGAFTIFESPWLSKILLGALAFNVALRLAIQAAALVRLARDHRNPSTLLDSGVDGAETEDGKTRLTIPAPVGPRSSALLAGRSPALLAGRSPTLLAGRSPTPLAGLLAYAGTLVLLAALFLNSIAGWRATEIALAPGSSTALGRPDAPRLFLEELTGSEADPTARVGLASQERNEPTSAGLIAAGQPIRWGNLWIALRSAGPALQATAKDSLGRPLLLQSLEPGAAGGLSQAAGVSEEVHLLFRQTQPEQEFALPSANLSFRVVSYPSLPEHGIDVPVFLVEVYEGDAPAPVLSDFVVDKAILVLNGSTLDLRRDRYAIVEAAYLPGLVPFVLGGLAILAGVILSLWSHPRAEAEVEGKSPGAELSTEPAHAS